MEQSNRGGPSTTGNKSNNGDVGARGMSELAQLDELRGRLELIRDRVSHLVRERPGTAILIALGLGFVVGRVVRS